MPGIKVMPVEETIIDNFIEPIYEINIFIKRNVNGGFTLTFSRNSNSYENDTCSYSTASEAGEDIAVICERLETPKSKLFKKDGI